MTRDDLMGRRFGRLLVIGRNGPMNRGIGWDCVCDCGTVCVVVANSLRGGKTRSCGCLQAELRHKAGDKVRTHGRRNDPIYCTWNEMRGRCQNPNDAGWAGYGGRGITVCERWQKFENFLADMGERPSPDHSLDRINNDGNYEPSNCRWATRSRQARNRRNTVRLEIDGQSVSLWDAAERAGLRPKTVYQRIQKGWPVDRALSTPITRGNQWTKRSPKKNTNAS